MIKSKIINAKQVSIIKDPETLHGVVKVLPENTTIEIDPTQISYDLRNREYYRVYEHTKPIGWIIADAVEVITNGKQHLN